MVIYLNNNKMRTKWMIALGIVLIIGLVGLFFIKNSFQKNNISNDRLDSEITQQQDSVMDNPTGDDENVAEHQINGIQLNSKKQNEKDNQANSIGKVKTDSDTLNIRDFNVFGDGKDETAAFQRALNAAVGKILYIPKQNRNYYLTGQLIIPTNSFLVFDSNVIIQSKDDLNQSHANFEALFRIENVNNVNIQANNALFRMNKSVYKGEHNHIFMINGASNITINKARANDSGGDGFYIGAYKTPKKYCENIKITNSVANNNRRQGISVISAKNLLIEDCIFRNTKGTSPEAGLDIEPNKFDDILENIIVRRCKSEGNSGRGFMLAISSFDSKSKEVSIRFENCESLDNSVGFASVYFLDGGTGTITFENCKAIRSKYSGFLEASCSATGILKKYINCEAISSNRSRNNSQSGSYASSFYIFESSRQPRTTIGNSIFENCKSIVDDKNPIVFRGISVLENGKAVAKDISIKNFQSRGHKELPINLNVKSKATSQNIQVQ